MDFLINKNVLRFDPPLRMNIKTSLLLVIGFVSVQALSASTALITASPTPINGLVAYATSGNLNLTVDGSDAKEPTLACCDPEGGEGNWNETGNPTYTWSNAATGTGASKTKPLSTAGEFTFEATPTQLWTCSATAATEPTDGTASSLTVTIVQVTQFAPKPGKGQICVNDTLTLDDFTVVTIPAGKEDELTFEWDGSESATPSSKQARLKLGATVLKTANYTVNTIGTWIPMANIPKPSVEGAHISKSNTAYHEDISIWSTTYYKTTVTYSGGFVWDQIGLNTVGGNSSYTTSQSKTWGISGSVAGEAEVGIPMVANAKVTVTIGGSWETSTSHSLTSGPDPEPYSYRYGHYQEVVGLSRTVETAKRSSLSAPWVNYTESGFSGTVAQPLSGAPRYLQTKERQCPAS